MIHNPCHSTQPAPVILWALDGDRKRLCHPDGKVRTFTLIHDTPDRTGQVPCKDTRTGVTAWFYPSSLQEVI